MRTPLPAAPPPTVLVVDDDPDLRTVLRLLLEDVSCRITWPCFCRISLHPPARTGLCAQFSLGY